MKAAGREFGGHGSCRARSVVAKVVAAPYESSRVVADIPSRQPLRDVRVAFWRRIRFHKELGRRRRRFHC